MPGFSSRADDQAPSENHARVGDQAPVGDQARVNDQGPPADRSLVDDPVHVDRPLRIVALGGGHGLSASLAALRRFSADEPSLLTAVVTVADDGGSSGRIRRELGVLPPGDLRMALAALAGSSVRDQRWAALFQHRFGGTGALAGHSVGNMLLTGLLEQIADPVAALAVAAESLGAVGRVLPMSAVPLDLIAEVEASDRDDPVRRRCIRGQSAIASTPARVRDIAVLPVDAGACAEAVVAVREADVVVLGPGSWYTSVIPHLLLPELADALCTTAADVILTLNLVPQPGETDGFSGADHLRVLRHYCPKITLSAVIADSLMSYGDDDLAAEVASFGAKLVCAPVRSVDAYDRHDPDALAAALRTALRSATQADPGIRADGDQA